MSQLTYVYAEGVIGLYEDGTLLRSRPTDALPPESADSTETVRADPTWFAGVGVLPTALADVVVA